MMINIITFYGTNQLKTQYKETLRPGKLYSTDDEVLRHAQIVPDGKKNTQFPIIFLFFPPTSHQS